jgi:hypothetical protein
VGRISQREVEVGGGREVRTVRCNEVAERLLGAAILASGLGQLEVAACL